MSRDFVVWAIENWELSTPVPVTGWSRFFIKESGMTPLRIKLVLEVSRRAVNFFIAKVDNNQGGIQEFTKSG